MYVLNMGPFPFILLKITLVDVDFISHIELEIYEIRQQFYFI